MNDHPLRLVDDNDIVILINDVQRDIFRFHCRMFGLPFFDPDDISFTKRISRLDCGIVYTDLSGTDQGLNMRTTHIRQKLRQI